jgi:hypothetical protein
VSIVSSGLFCKKPHRDRKNQIRDWRNRGIIGSFFTFLRIKTIDSVNLVTRNSKIGTWHLSNVSVPGSIHRVECIMDLLADLTIKEKMITLLKLPITKMGSTPFWCGKF